MASAMLGVLIITAIVIFGLGLLARATLGK